MGRTHIGLHERSMTNEDIRELVRLYELNRSLWDSKDEKFFVKKVREEIWKDISDKMDMSVKSLKEKMTSLMGSYRREKSREKRSVTYKSKWFAYEWFQFLTDRDNPKIMVADTGEITEAQDFISMGQNIETDDEQNEGGTRKRPSNSTVELHEIREDLTSALSRIDRVLRDQQNEVDEDEFDLYGKLLARKLRRLSYGDSQRMMYQIDGMLLNRTIHNDPIFMAGRSSFLPSPETVIITKRSVSPSSAYASPVPSP